MSPTSRSWPTHFVWTGFFALLASASTAGAGATVGVDEGPQDVHIELSFPSGRRIEVLFNKAACVVRTVRLDGETIVADTTQLADRRTVLTYWPTPVAKHQPFQMPYVGFNRDDGKKSPELINSKCRATFRRVERQRDTVRLHYTVTATIGGSVGMTECFAPCADGLDAGLLYWIEYSAEQEVNWATYNWLRFADGARGSIDGAVSILPAHHRFAGAPTYFVWRDDPFQLLKSPDPLNNGCGFASIAFAGRRVAVVVAPERVAGICEEFSLSNTSDQMQSMEIRDDSGASGGKCIASLLLSVAELTVDVPKTGSYRLWARCRWTNVGRPGEGNSFFESVDNGPKRVLGNDTADGWHWVHGGLYALEPGARVLKIHVREPNSLLDRLCLSADPKFTPDGKGRTDGPARALWIEAEASGRGQRASAQRPEIRVTWRFLANHSGSYRTPAVRVLLGRGDAWDVYYAGYDLMLDGLRREYGVERTVFEPTLDVRHVFFKGCPPGGDGHTFASLADTFIPLATDRHIRWFNLDGIEHYYVRDGKGSPYNQIDYVLRDELGGDRGLRYLCLKAHRAGIKVIQRFYTSINRHSGIAREHPDWFVQNRDGSNLVTFSDWVWDLANPKVRSYLLERIRHKQTLGVDGIETTPPPDAYAWHYGRNDAAQSAGFWRLIADIQRMGMIAIAECPKPAIGSGGCFLQAGTPDGGHHPYESLTHQALRQTLMLGQTVNFSASYLTDAGRRDTLREINRKYNAVYAALGPFTTRVFHKPSLAAATYGRSFTRAAHPYEVRYSVYSSPFGEAAIAAETVELNRVVQLRRGDALRLIMLGASGELVSEKALVRSADSACTRRVKLGLRPGDTAILTTRPAIQKRRLKRLDLKAPASVAADEPFEIAVTCDGQPAPEAVVDVPGAKLATGPRGVCRWTAPKSGEIVVFAAKGPLEPDAARIVVRRRLTVETSYDGTAIHLRIANASGRDLATRAHAVVAGETMAADATVPQRGMSSVRFPASPAAGNEVEVRVRALDEIVTQRYRFDRTLCRILPLRNAGFELPQAGRGAPIGWTTHGDPRVEMATRTSHSGRGSAMLSSSVAAIQGIAASVAVQAGKHYRYSLWARTENVSCFRIELWFFDAAGKRLGGVCGGHASPIGDGANGAVASIEDWQRCWVSAQAPASSVRAQCMATLRQVRPGSRGTVWVDDAEVVALPNVAQAK